MSRICLEIKSIKSQTQGVDISVVDKRPRLILYVVKVKVGPMNNWKWACIELLTLEWFNLKRVV